MKAASLISSCAICFTRRYVSARHVRRHFVWDWPTLASCLWPKFLLDAVHRFLLLGFVFLSGLGPIPARAGHLEGNWSGWIEFEQYANYNLYAPQRSGHWYTKDGHRVAEWERFESSSWLVLADRLISISLEDGQYDVSMRGNIDLVTSHSWLQNIFQPVSSHLECGWGLVMSAEPHLDNPGAAILSLEGPSCDGKYSISVKGVGGHDQATYKLWDSSGTPNLCGLKGIDKSEPCLIVPVDDPPTPIQSTSLDRDNLVGQMDSPLQAGPGPLWYSELMAVLEAQMPPAVTLPDPGKLFYYSDVSWKLSRPAGHWAGTITITRVSNLTTNGSWSLEPELDCINKVETYNHGFFLTNTVVITIPEQGGPGSAEGTFSYYGWTTNGWDADRDCNHGLPPPMWSHEHSESISIQTKHGNGSAQGGELQVIPMAGGNIFFKCPLSLPMTGIKTATTTRLSTGGSDPPIDETSSTTVPCEDSEVGTSFMGKLSEDCEHTRGSDLLDLSYENHPMGRLFGYLLTTWDLHLVRSTGQSSATSRLNPARTRRLLGQDPSPRPLRLSSGTVLCMFTNHSASSMTVPEGMPQAGSTFQHDSTFAYAASVTNSGASTLAVVRASEFGTNHATSLQQMVITDSDDLTTATATNDLPTTFDHTFSATLQQVRPAIISATTDGDQYWVHVVIPEATGGHRESIFRLTCEGCPPLLPTEQAFTMDDWSAGSRILDFHGVVNPSAPSTLVGQITFDHGMTQWNLNIDTSPTLYLTVTPTADGLVVSWDTGPGISVQETTSLNNPDWRDIPNSLGTNMLTLPTTRNAAFLRLLKR